MDVLYGILGFVVLIGIGYLIYRLKVAARKAVNQKILFRSAHKEGQMLVSQTLTVETPATAEDIMRELDAHVTTAINKLGFISVLYISSRGANRITYAYGNRIQPKIFEAVVGLGSSSAKTVGVYKILTWHEIDGMIGGRKIMSRLRDQVQAAFKAVGAAPAWLCACGNANDKNAVYCEKCGQRKQVPEPVAINNDAAPVTWACNCGKMNDKNAVYCEKCGQRKQVTEPVAVNNDTVSATWACSCGKTYGKDDIFCANCGRKKQVSASVAINNDAAPATWVCSCGKTNGKDDIFCANCGRKGYVQEPADVNNDTVSATWACSCGKTNGKDDIFCANCGRKGYAQEPVAVNNDAAPTTWMCMCGMINDTDAQHCINCGDKRPVQKLQVMR